MFRIVRFPSKIDIFFHSLKTEFRFGHFEYFRMLVLLITASWKDRNVSSLHKFLDKDPFPHSTRYNNFMNIARWEPEKLLANKAYESLESIGLREGETIYMILDDSKKDKRGKEMDAVGCVYDPVSKKSICGHQYIKAAIYARSITIPFAVRLYVKDRDSLKLEIHFRKVTELAAEIIRSFAAPKGIKVIVLFDAYYLCPVVTKACKEKKFYYISVLKSNRNLKKHGKKLKSGTYGTYCFKTKEKSEMKISKGYGISSYKFADAGWIEVSKLELSHLIFSRKNSERKILALVTDHPRLKAVDIIRSYNISWNIEVFFKRC